MRKLIVTSLLALLPAVAAAQYRIDQQPAPAGGANVQIAPTPDDAAPVSGVYVQDSAIALDRMALAQRMEGLKEWGKSAEIYQEIIEKFSDRVVPSHLDDKGAVDQYTSVMTLVNQRLRAWPPDGLAVYRTRYELTAQSLIRSAQGDNVAPLHEVFTRYFVSDSGKQAGLRLIDAYFELGDFPAATWIGEALLNHPNIEAERPRILFRVGLAAHFSGDQSLAQSTLDELKTHYPGTIGSVGGRDVNLAGELQDDLSRPVGQGAVSTADGQDDSWPTPGGDLTRGKISFSAARPGAKLYTVNLPPPLWRAAGEEIKREQLQSNYEQFRDEGKMLGIMPAVDRGEMFFQDNARLYALNIDTGQSLPGWLATYPAHNGQYVVSAEGSAAAKIGPPEAAQLCITLTDTSVLAVMGLPSTLLTTFNLADPHDARLVCLDRATGRENWTVSSRDLPVDTLKNLRIGGAPLVAGSNVYLAGISSKGNGYEDCYVLCFDLATGKYRWSTYVSGAPMAGQTLYNPNTGYSPLAHLPAHLSYAGGRLFVVAGVGSVAALDAYSGNVDWLNIYREPDDAVNPANMGFGMGMGGFGAGGFRAQQFQQPGAPWNPPSPWALSAPLVHGGNVFVLPTDGKYILVYDAGDGRLVKRLEKSNCCQSNGGDVSEDSQPDTLLGVLDGALVHEGAQDKREDLLLVATPESVCALRWREYDALHPEQTVVWTSGFSGTDSLRGQPFVTTDSVFVPAAHALYRLDLRTGKIGDSYPAQTDPSSSVSSWPTGEGPGNVLAVGNHVVIAGDRGVSVYTGIDLAIARLDKEISAAPGDPNARLHYAETMFLNNQTPQALARLDEAIQLLNAQTDGSRDIAARDRAFNDALTFAVRSTQNAATTASANPLFDRATALASSPGQKVNYRLARARFARYGAQPDLAAAIRLYQEILADPSLRNVAIATQQIFAPASAASDTPQDMDQAGVAAVTAIDSITKTAEGAAAYQTFEQAARKEFEAATNAGDPDRLLAVAESFPNSKVASSAAVHAAELFETAGRTRQAIAVWRDISPRVINPAQQAIAWEALARNYLKLPSGLPAAANRLSAAAKLNSDAKLTKPLTIPGAGKVLPIGTPLGSAGLRLVEALSGRSPGLETNLPNFGLASGEDCRAFRKQYHTSPDPFLPQPALSAKVDKLIVPAQEFSRYDRVIAWTQGAGLSLYPVGAQEPVGTDADVTAEPRGAAWVNSGNGLLVWTANQLFMISPRQAQTQWKLTIQTLPELDVMALAAHKEMVHLIEQADPRTARGQRRNQLMPIRNRPFAARALPGQGGVNLSASTDEIPDTSGAETITDLIPLTDSAILTTSTGRIMTLKLDDGSIQWDLRLSEHALDRVVATDDFVVAKSSDESSVQLTVLDAGSGRRLARHLYPIDQQLGQYPVNLALDVDGTMAFTTTDKIYIFDLFKPAADHTLNSPRQFVDALPDKEFDAMRRPGQLVISNNQILALCTDGKLRGFSALSGSARTYIQDHSPTEMSLLTGQQNDQTAMRLGDRYVYIWGPAAVAAYDMEKPEISWGDPQTISAASSSRQLLLGRDYMLVLSPTTDGDSAAAWTMWGFARTQVPGKGSESGLMVYQQHPVNEPHGISAFQAVEGGLYYLSGDHVLHYLKGNTHPTQ